MSGNNVPFSLVHVAELNDALFPSSQKKDAPKEKPYRPSLPNGPAVDTMVANLAGLLARQAGVVGAGQMGGGIATALSLCARISEVRLYDASSSALASAKERHTAYLKRSVERERIPPSTARDALKKLHFVDTLPAVASSADVVIEAVAECMKSKGGVFSALSSHAPATAVLATNTSSLSITHVATFASAPARVVGLHFFHPAVRMPVVEVVPGVRTADATVDYAVALAEALGKRAAVAKDAPGFVANRVLMPMINEAFFALDEGVAGKGDIDAVMKLGAAHPMGPLELADFIGLDTCLAIMGVLHKEFGDSKYRPAGLLVRLVRAGRLGRKTGHGVYEYPR